VILAATGAGVAAERRWPDRVGHGTRRALVLVLYTLIPFATFFNIARLDFDADIGGGIALGWVALAVAAAIAWATGRFLLRLERPAIGALMSSTWVANTGYLGYPLTAALLGFDSLGEAVAYDILVSAPALLLGAFATGAAFGTRAGETVGDRMIAFFTRNPPLFAAIAGLLAPDSLAPDALLDASRIAVVAILPVGFFAVGAVLTEEAEEGAFRLRSPLRPPVAAATAIRLAVAPGLLYLLALPFIDLPGPYLLLAAMPCGINTLVVAHIYGLDLRVTAEAVAWSTAIALVVVLVAAAAS
jgi:predicted permease